MARSYNKSSSANSVRSDVPSSPSSLPVERLGRVSELKPGSVPDDVMAFIENTDAGGMYDNLEEAAFRAKESFTEFLDERFGDDRDPDGASKTYGLDAFVKSSDGFFYRVSFEAEFNHDGGRTSYDDPSEADAKSFRVSKIKPLPGADLDSDGEFKNRAQVVAVNEDAIKVIRQEIENGRNPKTFMGKNTEEEISRKEERIAGLQNTIEKQKAKYPDLTTPEVVDAWRKAPKGRGGLFYA